MFQRLGTGNLAKRPRHLVVLVHDIAFRPHEITGGESEKAKLVEFLKMAVEAGYKFDTIDNYPEELD